MSLCIHSVRCRFLRPLTTIDPLALAAWSGSRDPNDWSVVIEYYYAVSGSRVGRAGYAVASAGGRTGSRTGTFTGPGYDRTRDDEED